MSGLGITILDDAIGIGLELLPLRRPLGAFHHDAGIWINEGRLDIYWSACSCGARFGGNSTSSWGRLVSHIHTENEATVLRIAELGAPRPGDRLVMARAWR